MQFLSTYADLRPDRAAEIVAQADVVVPFFASIGFLRPDAKRWTMELLEVVLQLARYVEQRVKHGWPAAGRTNIRRRCSRSS